MARCNSNALSLLASYGSDSDQDSGYTSEDERKRKSNFDEENRAKPKKRLKPDIPEEDETMMDCVEESHCSLESTRIPLPAELSTSVGVKDEPELHQGRHRTFAWERGNWVSLLYVPLLFGIHEPHMASLLSVLTKCCQESNLAMDTCSDLHISLSRTLVLRLHWINDVVSGISKRLENIPKFSVWMEGLGAYTNEDRSRTFLGLKVMQGKHEMKEIVQSVNDSIAEYRLPPFYEECSFHASLLWCNGDHVEALQSLLPVLETACHQYFSLESDMRAFEVEQLVFKAGFKTFQIPLKN